MSAVPQFFYKTIAGKQWVYINIVDSVTGNPTNGNNMSVTYTQILNGGPPQVLSKIIPGQSVEIWEGNINPANSWALGGTVDDDGPDDPPVSQCDLKINTIHVDKSESNPGEGDGQITISASSSYLPMQYSLDNITWQTSPIFTGLQGGKLYVYVKDANTAGCNFTGSVTIPITSNLLISDPSITINGNTSRWNAAFNPIVFTYQRCDFEVTGITNDSQSGNAIIAVNAIMNDIETAITANQTIIDNAAAQGITLINSLNIYVYLNAGPYNGVYKVNSSDGYTLTLNTPYVEPAAGQTDAGFININMLRPYYRILTYITYLDPLTNTYKTITSVNRPNNQGIVKADISNFLQSILQVKDGSNYTLPNYCDVNLSASYTIQYCQQYDDYTKPGLTVPFTLINIVPPYYVTYTARQIQSKNGGNMAAYVPFQNPLTLAKWITDFTEPVYSQNYPFDISFIYSEALSGLSLYYNITLLDINRQPIPGNIITSSLLNEDTSWLLNQDDSKLLINSQSLTSTPILQQLGLNRLLINLDLQAEVYYFNIAVFYNNTDGSPVQVTQTQTIRVDHAPDINAVYMRWIGLTGSRQLIE